MSTFAHAAINCPKVFNPEGGQGFDEMLKSRAEMKMPIQSEIERRSRLVLLVYDLRDMQAPAEEATNTAVLSDLSRAFSERATALDGAPAQASLEAASRGRRKSVKFSMAKDDLWHATT